MTSSETTGVQTGDRADRIDTLVRAVRERCATFNMDYWAACDAEDRYPEEFVDAMAAGGWLGMNIPEEYGGGELDHLTIAGLLREIAASGAGLDGCIPVHMSMFTVEPILSFGSEHLKSTFLPRVASGETKMCFAVSEPNSGSDTSKVQVKARPAQGGWLLSGQKIWITISHVADQAIVLARTGPAPEADRFGGLSLFLADLDPAHVTIRSIPKLAHNAAPSCEVFFDDLPVREDRLIGQEGQGFRHLLAALNSERVLMASEMVGIGEVALRTAVDYAKSRVVFDRPIGANQSISHPLASAHTQLAAAWMFTQNAADRLDRGLPCGAEANGAKFLAAEAAFAAADAALQTLGGMGFAREYHVERWFREARLCRVAPISQEMTLNYLAQTVLGLPRSY